MRGRCGGNNGCGGDGGVEEDMSGRGSGGVGFRRRGNNGCDGDGGVGEDGSGRGGVCRG